MRCINQLFAYLLILLTPDLYSYQTCKKSSKAKSKSSVFKSKSQSSIKEQVQVQVGRALT